MKLLLKTSLYLVLTEAKWLLWFIAFTENNDKGIGFSEGKPNEISLKACCECIKEGLKTFFVPEGSMFETVGQSEPDASSSKAEIISKPKNFKLKAMINSDSKTSKIKILKRSELVPQIV